MKKIKKEVINKDTKGIKNYEIDQSGKIEQTNKDTVLCLSNGIWDTILVKAETKRSLLEVFRRNGQIRNFILFTFSAILAIIIERNINLGRIVIDREYYGKEPIIKKLLEEMSTKIKERAILEFGLVGKTSRADFIAGEVFSGKIKPKSTITKEELLKVIKKTEVGKQLKDA
ncbi:MAG: hypothetical protein HY344_03965 [Candidatus Levybacteria bacterium]|nr:hypothetical protein [Candidatus Levybacteria bacterium]